MVSVEGIAKTKSLCKKDLDQEIIRLIKNARELQNKNYKGSVQEFVVDQMRQYLSDHED